LGVTDTGEILVCACRCNRYKTIKVLRGSAIG
jgi:hypothetical protein